MGTIYIKLINYFTHSFNHCNNLKCKDTLFLKLKISYFQTEQTLRATSPKSTNIQIPVFNKKCYLCIFY